MFYLFIMLLSFFVFYFASFSCQQLFLCFHFSSCSERVYAVTGWTLWIKTASFGHYQEILLFRFKNILREYIEFIVCTTPHPHHPFCWGGWASNQIFKKEGLDRTSTFRGGLLGKRSVTFFKGRGLQFSQKEKLKSEIFNDKSL